MKFNFDLKTILLLGGLAVGGYLLYTNFMKKDTVQVFPPPPVQEDNDVLVPTKGIQNYEKPSASAHNIDYIGASGDAVANYATPNYMRGWY